MDWLLSALPCFALLPEDLSFVSFMAHYLRACTWKGRGASGAKRVKGRGGAGARGGAGRSPLHSDMAVVSSRDGRQAAPPAL